MTSTKIPIEQKIFTIPSLPEEKPYLVAAQCDGCNEIMFPYQDTCPNCGKRGLRMINLSRRGRIVVSTIVRYPPQLYNGSVPYVVAKVELPEGITVPSIVRGWQKDEPPPYGLEVEVDLEVFGVDEQGNEILSYIFKPC